MSFETAWRIWLATGVVMETVAAARGKTTLSQHIWLWADSWWKKTILGSFLAWLTVHLVFRI